MMKNLASRPTQKHSLMKKFDEMNLLLYTKERFNLSNDAYHELSMACKELPRSWQIQK